MRKRSQKSSAHLRRAAAIARKQPWCDPKRVAECYDCVCRKEARGIDPFPIRKGRGPGPLERAARVLGGAATGNFSRSYVERRRIRNGTVLATVGATVVVVKD
jgi:hypothetical protein